jgi:DNA-directed RNA polymerase specialized sigma subunit
MMQLNTQKTASNNFSDLSSYTDQETYLNWVRQHTDSQNILPKQAMENALQLVIHDMLQGELPLADRQLINGVFIQGLSDANYAKMHGISRSSVRFRKQKAMQKLKNHLNYVLLFAQYLVKECEK